MLITHSIIFAFSVVVALRGIIKSKDISASVILAAYSFITMCSQLEWSMITHLDGLLTNTPR